MQKSQRSKLTIGGRTISSGIKRYDSRIRSPKPPGAIVSPVKARECRAMSIMSSEILKLSPEGHPTVRHYSSSPLLVQGAEKKASATTSDSEFSTSSDNLSIEELESQDSSINKIRSESSLPVQQHKAEVNLSRLARSFSENSAKVVSPKIVSPKILINLNLKSLRGSSYDLDSFYSSLAPRTEEEQKQLQQSQNEPEKLFHSSPRGSPKTLAAAERSGRRLKSPRTSSPVFFPHTKCETLETQSLTKTTSSKLQMLDDLLAQVKITQESFSKQLGSAKKDAKRILKRSERSNRRLTYTKSQIDDALFGAQDSVAAFKGMLSRHTLGSLPTHSKMSNSKQRWIRLFRKVSFKNAVARTSKDLLSRSEKARKAKLSRRGSKEYFNTINV